MLDVIGVTIGDRGATPIIDDVTFVVGAGEWYTLVGPPGAGKSVLLETILGVRKPTQGCARVAGIDVAREPLRARSHITYVAGTGALLPAVPLWRNVRWFLQLVGVRRCTRGMIERALREAEVPDVHLSRPARSLPAHERLGTWLAIAALRKSSVLILDDPGRDLSARASEQLAWQLDDRRRRGTCILVTSRDALFGAVVPHRIGLLEGGRMAAEYDYVSGSGTDVRTLLDSTIGPPASTHQAVR